MARINCENKNPRRPIDLSKVRKIADAALGRLYKRGEVEINIVFVSNQKIRAMNRRYLGVDASTDVLAFWQDGPAREKRRFLGDIVISSDKAAMNAKEYNMSFAEEMALYIVHGILHLGGHDHRTKKSKTRMRELENGLLKNVRKFL